MCTAGNPAFVCLAYVKILGRTPDAGGVASWVAAINGGLSRVGVAEGLLTSPEYRQDLVNRFYEQYLHRPADPEGLAAFVRAVQGGATDEAVQASLLGSAEYSPASASAQSFLGKLYPDVLHRSPDAAGLAHWTAVLQAGASHKDVASAFLASQEYRTDLVEQDYPLFLDRPADPAGLASWVAALDQSRPDEAVIAGLVGSAEFGALADQGAPPAPATRASRGAGAAVYVLYHGQVLTLAQAMRLLS